MSSCTLLVDMGNPACGLFNVSGGRRSASLTCIWIGIRSLKRLDKDPGSGCIVNVAGVNISDGTVSSKSKAILDFEFVLGPPLTSTPGRFYFTSDCPDDYVFAYACANLNNIIEGVCYDRLLVDIIIFKLDRPPMHKIVRELWKKFGLKFDDPRNTYNRIGLPCTEDV
ncbi:hypothetical protein MAR_018529, partial [Mya arenaria]